MKENEGRIASQDLFSVKTQTATNDIPYQSITYLIKHKHTLCCQTNSTQLPSRAFLSQQKTPT